MGVSVSSRHSTATTATSSEPPWKKYRPSRAPHRLTHVLSERNIAPARSKWAKYCTFRRAGAKNISRHPTTPHAGAVFLSPQLHPDPQAGHNSPCSALSAYTRETVRPASSISAAVCEKVRPASPNGRKTLFSGVLGEFFRGDVAGGAVSGEFFRAVGLAAGPIYWHPRCCTAKPHWWRGGQPARTVTHRVNARRMRSQKQVLTGPQASRRLPDAQ